MKKKSFYGTSLLLLVLMLNSCTSNNESENQSNNSTLVKKSIKTYSANDVSILTYKYDGNKIVSENSDSGFIANYTYTGNVISKIEETVDNKFQRSREYTYKDGKVSSEIEKTNYSGTDTHTYTYNSNGTVSYNRTRTGSENTTGLLTIVNGNIIKNEVFYGGKYPTTYTYIYTYDTKNNPFKNVLGFNLLLDTDEEMFSINNMTEDGGGTPAIKYTFVYDSNNFPTEKKSDANSGNERVQYFY